MLGPTRDTDSSNWAGWCLVHRSFHRRSSRPSSTAGQAKNITPSARRPVSTFSCTRTCGAWLRWRPSPSTRGWGKEQKEEDEASRLLQSGPGPRTLTNCVFKAWRVSKLHILEHVQFTLWVGRRCGGTRSCICLTSYGSCPHPQRVHRAAYR